MLCVNIICVGKLKEKYLKLACDEYIKRLGAFCRILVTELSEYKLPQNPSDSEIEKCILSEGDDILSRTKGFKIAMCIEGSEFSSEQLAKKLSDLSIGGISEISFIIGGSYGLSDKVKKSADLCLSVSKMTFPHQLFRVMLLEQVYRAFQISSNGKYHK